MGQNKRENHIGIAKATTWGTDVEPGTDNGIIATGWTPGSDGADQVPNDNEFGRGLVTNQQIMDNNAVNSDLEVPGYFDNVTQLMAMAYGMYGSAVSPGAEGIKHTFKLNEIIDNIYSTIAWDERDESKVIPANVLNSLGISNDNGLSFAANFIGTTISIAGAYSTPLGVTYESASFDKMKTFNTDVYLKNFEDGAFADSDKLCVNSFEPVLQRGYEVQEHCFGDANIKAPQEVNPPTFDISLGFPKKDDKNKLYQGYFRTNQKMKMKVVITGGFITSAENYSLTLYFPLVQVMNDPVYDQESPLPVSLDLRMIKADTIPTGFTTLVPMAELVNSIAALTGYPVIV